MPLHSYNLIREQVETVHFESNSSGGIFKLNAKCLANIYLKNLMKNEDHTIERVVIVNLDKSSLRIV